VGRALAQLLIRKRLELRQRYDVAWRAVGISTGSHGSLWSPDGIDLDQACRLVESGGRLESLPGEPVGTPLALLDRLDTGVMFELSPVNYETGQPALGHIERALQRGLHAVTANKGPVVHGAVLLSALAREQSVRFLFESTVMDGAPIFSLWRETLPAAELRGFRGVLNSTTNMILGLMEDGQSFEQAVSKAQAIGIAETDPSGDIDGWDASVKVAALVSVLMGVPMTPQQVERRGIREISLTDVQTAAGRGQRWKLVCEAQRQGKGVSGRVQPVLLQAEDPLYGVTGTSSAVTFLTDSLGPLTVLEQDPGPETTAYGLLADFLRATLGDLGLGG
jgi:homoserine dehydrogenase